MIPSVDPSFLTGLYRTSDIADGSIRIRRTGRDGLPKDPALDLCRGVVRRAGWRIAEHNIEHTQTPARRRPRAAQPTPVVRHLAALATGTGLSAGSPRFALSPASLLGSDVRGLGWVSGRDRWVGAG